MGAVALMLFVAACSGGGSGGKGGGPSAGLRTRDEALFKTGPTGEGAWILPTGRRIQPLGTMTFIDRIPLGLALSPDGRTLFAVTSGTGRESVNALDATTGALLATLVEPSLFLGLAITRDGRTLYASRGGAHGVAQIAWDGARLAEVRTIQAPGFVGALALSSDEAFLYAVDQGGSGFHVLDLAAGSVIGDTETGGNPYAVVVARDGAEAYVSAERAGRVEVIDVRNPRAPQRVASITVQKNPEGMALSADGTRLSVANADEDSVSLIDVRARRVIRHVDLRTIDKQGYGTGPNGLAFSPDGRRLYVAHAVDNRVGVVDLDGNHLVGSIPTAWYPVAVAVSPDGRRLFVSNAKGTGAGRTDDGIGQDANNSTIQILEIPDDATLASLASTIDGWNRRSAELFEIDPVRFASPVPLTPGSQTPFEHVFLVVRENKTYDALLGDFPRGDGVSKNCLYCAEITPNLHALVERFASGDNYYTTAEVSDQGHEILTAGISNTYLEKIRFAVDRPISVSLEAFLSPAVWPKTLYLYQALLAAGIDFRTYGDETGLFVNRLILDQEHVHWGPKDPPIFWLQSRDVDKIAERIAEWESRGLPRFVYMELPNDHTSGCQPPYPSPRSMVADNDLATGQFLDWLSHSTYWRSSLAFVVEDDPQQGVDHVDAHRSILLVASPWVRRGFVSPVHYHEGNIHATIEHVLGLSPRTPYDETAEPMWDLFTNEPDLTPFTALPRTFPEEVSLPGTNCGLASANLEWVEPDRAVGLQRILIENEREAREGLGGADGSASQNRWDQLLMQLRDLESSGLAVEDD